MKVFNTLTPKMEKMKLAELRNGKLIADIVPVMLDLPSWMRRKAQPLIIGSGSVSRLILEERGSIA